VLYAGELAQVQHQSCFQKRMSNFSYKIPKLKRLNKCSQARQNLPISHCRVLPPGEFNGMVLELLAVCSKSVTVIAPTVSHNAHCIFTKLQKTKIATNITKKEKQQIAGYCWDEVMICLLL